MVLHPLFSGRAEAYPLGLLSSQSMSAKAKCRRCQNQRARKMCCSFFFYHSH